MDSPRQIFFILLYIAVTSSLIAAFAAGMGYSWGGSDVVNYTAPSEDSIFQSLPGFGETYDTASFISSFIQSIISVLFWTLPNELMPLWANVVFIKIPIIYLVVCVVEVLLP